MWHMTLQWWELVARGAIIYVFLMLILRLSGQRQMGHLAPFDLILLLVLSNTVQNAMNGGDNSVPAGILLACTVVALNYIVSLLTFYSPTLAAWVEGRGIVLIRHGKVDERARRRAMLTREELMAALRNSDCAAVEDVHYAILENTGEITVQRRRHAKH